MALVTNCYAMADDVACLGDEPNLNECMWVAHVIAMMKMKLATLACGWSAIMEPCTCAADRCHGKTAYVFMESSHLFRDGLLTL